MGEMINAEILKGRDHLRVLGRGSRMILKMILKEQVVRMQTILLVQDQWQSLINTVTNLRVP
jgi:hypothetical protein